MKMLDAVPQGRVLEDITCRSDLYKLARRVVDEVISELSEHLSDSEVEQVVSALHGLLNRWQGQQTNK